MLDWKRDVIDPFVAKADGDLKRVLRSDSIRPDKKNVFRAFELTPYEATKVIILGQDPYPGNGVADGLAFSASDDLPTPKSLQNIFKKICMDFHIDDQKGFFPSNRLDNWARSGILLLNTTLTFEKNTGIYHKNIWKGFTETVIKSVSAHPKPIIVILWGREAQKYEGYVDGKHTVLKSVHPSPLSAYKGFFEIDHFIRIKRHLGLDFSFSTAG